MGPGNMATRELCSYALPNPTDVCVVCVVLSMDPWWKSCQPVGNILLDENKQN